MKVNDSFQNLNFPQNNFKVRAFVLLLKRARAFFFCFQEARAQTRAQLFGGAQAGEPPHGASKGDPADLALGA